MLTLYSIFYLVLPCQSSEIRQAGRRIEYLTVLFGAACTVLWGWLGGFSGIKWSSDWHVQLYGTELHTPIATWTLPTVITIAVVVLLNYLTLRMHRPGTVPPLLAALAIGGLYLGAALCAIWILQIMKHDYALCLYPFNLLLIFAKTVKEVVLDWRSEHHPELTGKARAVITLNRLLSNSASWPWFGMLCTLPLLGLMVAVLILFGQAPDSIIQAWTQTSDWTFSQQSGPQNIFPDGGHYLCTVAATGHKKLVKPIRVGIRHGRRILVNRQLCIANAFEQLLEKRIPTLHRFIRYIYDRYGYPIAKHIHSAYAADAVWILMKPLEWLFLAVLYLFDTKPENRISVQYPHAPIPKQ